MDTLFQGLAALACAIVSSAVPILLPRALTVLAGNIHDKRIALIADAATRAAGRIVVGVADQLANPGATLKGAVAAAAAAEVSTLKAQLPETIAKVGASDATLQAMIKGEVGKIVGQAVAR